MVVASARRLVITFVERKRKVPVFAGSGEERRESRGEEATAKDAEDEIPHYFP